MLAGGAEFPVAYDASTPDSGGNVTIFLEGFLRNDNGFFVVYAWEFEVKERPSPEALFRSKLAETYNEMNIERAVQAAREAGLLPETP